jgi:hypothetical protein
VLHRPKHESPCDELTRICDHPTCKKRADSYVRCRRCKVATYCNKRHKSKPSAAHEERREDLRVFRKADKEADDLEKLFRHTISGLGKPRGRISVGGKVI